MEQKFNCTFKLSIPKVARLKVKANQWTKANRSKRKERQTARDVTVKKTTEGNTMQKDSLKPPTLRMGKNTKTGKGKEKALLKPSTKAQNTKIQQTRKVKKTIKQ